MTELKKIQKRILALKSQIAEAELPSSKMLGATRVMFDDKLDKLKGELEILKTKESFILARRESWLPKTLWIFIFPLLLLLIGMILKQYFYDSKPSSFELYKINTDCSQKAIAYAKEKSDGVTYWNVVQTNFNKKRESCFAEFNQYFNPTNYHSSVIIDITHSKEFLSYPLPYKEGDDITIYNGETVKYENTVVDIFGKHNSVVRF